jgi:hypothetical protein
MIQKQKFMSAYETFKRCAPPESRPYIGTSPVFENEDNPEFLPLQAADMIAWHARRYHEDIMASRIPDNPLFRQLYVTEHVVDVWDEDRLNNQLSKHIFSVMSRFKSVNLKDRRLWK